MAAGDRIIIGIRPGVLYLQPDSKFTETDWGVDSGMRQWLTHPDTPESSWPVKGQPDAHYRGMFISEVTDTAEECGLIMLTARYRGVKFQRAGAGNPQKVRVIPDCDAQPVTFPSLIGSTKSSLIIPVPKPRVTREYITTTQPTYADLGASVSGSFLPAPPAFLITFTPDPDQRIPRNYLSGWILDSRTWDQEPNVTVWTVREHFSYQYSLAI